MTEVFPRSVWSTEDTLNFWKGIADVGLLEEVVTNISTELLELLNSVQQLRDLAPIQDTGTQEHYSTTVCTITTVPFRKESTDLAVRMEKLTAKAS